MNFLLAEKKTWGLSHQLFSCKDFLVYFATASGGGESSIHLHESLDNIIYITSGTLSVFLFNDEGLLECESLLFPGQEIRIEAGVKHQFKAIKDSSFIEIYVAPGAESVPMPLDITRIQ